jgi:type V secretory pathway adhesin AidA
VNNNIHVLAGGTLAAWNAVQGNATLSAAGVDTINGNVANGGKLLLSAANNSVGNNFTINGDYTGSAGSQIVLNSTLGEDNAPTDHLTITGSSFGQSGVSVSNMGAGRANRKRDGNCQSWRQFRSSAHPGKTGCCGCV